MNFRQIQTLNRLEKEFPELRELVLELREEINAINERINAIQSKKGATPGVLQLKTRVEKLENAFGQRDSVNMRSGTDR